MHRGEVVCPATVPPVKRAPRKTRSSAHKCRRSCDPVLGGARPLCVPAYRSLGQGFVKQEQRERLAAKAMGGGTCANATNAKQRKARLGSCSAVARNSAIEQRVDRPQARTRAISENSIPRLERKAVEPRQHRETVPTPAVARACPAASSSALRPAAARSCQRDVLRQVLGRAAGASRCPAPINGSTRKKGQRGALRAVVATAVTRGSEQQRRASTAEPRKRGGRRHTSPRRRAAGTDPPGASRRCAVTGRIAK